MSAVKEVPIKPIFAHCVRRLSGSEWSSGNGSTLSGSGSDERGRRLGCLDRRLDAVESILDTASVEVEEPRERNGVGTLVPDRNDPRGPPGKEQS